MAAQQTPAHDGDPTLGVLVLSGGQVVAALGPAADPATQTALRRALAGRGDRSLVKAELPDGPAIAVVLSHGDTEIAIHRPTDAEGALADFVTAVPFAFSILEQILTDPYQAITVADHTGAMRYISPVHEKFLGLRPGECIGKPAEDVIPNSRLRAVLTSGKAEIGQPQVMNGVTRVVNRRPIVQHGHIVGAVGQVMFKEPEAVSRMYQEMTQLRSQLEFYRRELNDLRETQESLAELVGDGQAMRRLKREIATVAKLDVPVLILGESGTGKELVARAIHKLGRPKRALVSLNLAALPASLIESELFGYSSGAFTGGTKQGRSGKFELANDGTLFLDEVGDIPLEIQTKLLRVLEDRMVERLGSHESKRTTFRLVSATHRDVDTMMESGAFRQDLFYRISGVTLRVAPLRQRLEDIPALLNHFTKAFCERNGLPVPAIASGVARYLADQRWPGNLRQLRHRIEEALVFSEGGELRIEAFIREDVSHSTNTQSVSATPDVYSEAAADAPAQPTRLKDQERAAALRALEECGGNKKKAAERLGISRSYLYKLVATE